MAVSFWQLLLARVLSPVGKGVLATASAFAALLAALAQLPAIMHGDVLSANLIAHWDGGFAIALRIDGLSSLFMLMGTFTGTAILLYSVRYMEHEAQGLTRFYAIMLVFIAGLLVLASAADMLGAYLAWEVVGLCSYTLVGFWYKDQAATDGARKVLMITHLAGYGLARRPHPRLRPIRQLRLDRPGARPGLHHRRGGAADRLGDGQVGDVPAAHLDSRGDERADAGFRAAAFGLLRQMRRLPHRPHVFVGGGQWHAALGNLLLAMGCVTILVGVIFALAQTDLKRLLAFHTISQLGYIVDGTGHRDESRRSPPGCSIVSATRCSKARSSCAPAPCSTPPAPATCASSAVLLPRCPSRPCVWLVSAAASPGCR